MPDGLIANLAPGLGPGLRVSGAVKKILLIVGALVLVLGAGGGAFMVLSGGGDIAALPKKVAEPPPPPRKTSFLELTAMSEPVVSNGRVRRYSNIVGRYELLGSKADLAHAEELRPRLRDALVREYHRQPVALGSDGRDLDFDVVRSRFLATGKRVLGANLVQNVSVEEAQASQFRPSAPPPPRPSSSAH